ncbi:MAG: hypothetical protein U1F15_15385 [Burkholderiales bacterium]
MNVEIPAPKFPAGLLDWAGHRTGGVKRLFHDSSGRPAGQIIRTPLLDRLEQWAGRIRDIGAPRIVLLVGGPGNGKTEAVEFTVSHLDATLHAHGKLVDRFRDIFTSAGDRPAPRIAQVERGSLSADTPALTVALVQDASAKDPNAPGRSPAQLLVDDLEAMLRPGADTVYLACVNRGVLDDALIVATDGTRLVARNVLLAIVKSIGAGPDPVSCWPLDDYPAIAVWPMDVETLIVGPTGQSAASQLLQIATTAAAWPQQGHCAAGELCPFCYSRGRLATGWGSNSLLNILRWYELASGKRWSFRDLSSLISLLLAGAPGHVGAVKSGDPCEWAAQLVRLGSAVGPGQESIRTSAPFHLVAAQYEHALFAHWHHDGVRQLRRDLGELGLAGDRTLLGLYYFLTSTGRNSLPRTLESQLTALVDALDPGLAPPDTLAVMSETVGIPFRELDVRFSQSVREGLDYILKGARRNWFSRLEITLLESLALSDDQLSQPEVVRRHSAVAARVRGLVRNFACRLVRRSLGVRAAAVNDVAIVSEYERVAQGDLTLLHACAKQVQGLLNEHERFVISLNTTFGEALPPPERRAILTTPQQKVRVLEQPTKERPRPAFQYFSVGTGSSRQAIALTYDLFKAIFELRRGLLPASLPRPVVAQLDTARARLAGRLVRDEEVLEDSEVRIGLRSDVLVREQGEFLVRQEPSQ